MEIHQPEPLHEIESPDPAPHLQLIPPMEETTEPSALMSADHLRYMANAVSISRAVGGIGLAFELNRQSYPSRSLIPVAAVGVAALTDYIDGKLARQATAQDGETSRIGGWFDQLSDKIFTHAVIIGIARACYANKRPVIGTMVSAAEAVVLKRDIDVTRTRIRAEQQAEPEQQVNTAAQKHGKRKTVAQFFTIGALVSPIVKHRPAHVAAATMLGVTAGMAIRSGRKYAQELAPVE